jgi:hypothetical protein
MLVPGKTRFLFQLWLGRQRQADGHARALAELTFGGDAAAVGRHDRARDGEPEATAPLLAAAVASTRLPARSARRLSGMDAIGVGREPEYTFVTKRSPSRCS